MEACETSCREADERLAAARAELSGKLEAWAGRWTGDEPYAPVTAGQAELLLAALDGIGEPDAPSLAELFGTLTAESGHALTARRERLRTRDADLGHAAARLAEDRETVAGERDDGPPASDLRPAQRAERAGAPLWQLADFRPGVNADTAAAIEGALYGAGLLTAWVHPDPALTTTAVDAAEADGYLVALPPAARPTGRTLADILVPEQQDMVAPALVEAVLASIALADSIQCTAPLAFLSLPPGRSSAMVRISARGPSPPPSSSERPTGPPGAAFGWPSSTARSPGSSGSEMSSRRNSAWSARPWRTPNSRGVNCRRTAPVAAALQRVGEAAARLSVARGQLEKAKTALDEKIAELDARTRRLRRTAADRDMPVSPDEVGAVERAVAEFERAAEELVRARGNAADLGEDLKGRRARIDRLSGENDEAAELLGEKQTVLAGERRGASRS